MNQLLIELTDKDDKKAYARSKEIAIASSSSPEYYRYIDDFASLLAHDSSYVRTRGFVLCCSQARWDTEGKLQEILPAMLTLLHDPKPTVVRQCLKALKEVIAFRPELCNDIGREIGTIDLSKYKDSMSPLIRKDMDEVLELLA